VLGVRTESGRRPDRRTACRNLGGLGGPPGTGRHEPGTGPWDGSVALRFRAGCTNLGRGDTLGLYSVRVLRPNRRELLDKLYDDKL